MAAPSFGITIDADDRASKILGKLGAAGDQAGKKLRGLTGNSIAQVDKGLQGVARSGWDAARSITSAVEPLAVLTGASTLAGMLKLATAWGQFGRTLANQSTRLDVSTDSLQAMQGAAKLTGASAEDMTGGLAGLQQTLYDSTNGTNAKAIAWFNNLGIAFQDGSGHALKADAVFKQVATTISKLHNPAAQAAVASTFGIPESLLPLLRKGGAGIENLEQTATHYGGKLSAEDIRNAQAYAEAQAKLDLATTNLGHTLTNVLGPALTPVITSMADWMATNQGLIRADIEDLVKRTTKAAEGFADAVGVVVSDMGGWKSATEEILELYLGGRFLRALANVRLLGAAGSAASAAAQAGAGGTTLGYGGAIAAAVVAGLVENAVSEGGADKRAEVGHRNRAAGSGVYTTAPSSARDGWMTRTVHGLLQGFGIEGSDTPTVPTLGSGSSEAKVLNYFQTQSGGAWSKAQAAGLVANLQSESGMNPFAQGDKNKDGQFTAYGIGQWHAGRQADYAALFGHTMQSVTDQQAALSEQVAFVNYELSHKERSAALKLRGATGGYDAGDDVSRFYERPQAVEEAARNRGALALQLDGEPAGGNQGNVNVRVHVAADPGTKITRQITRSTGNVDTTRTSTAMPYAGLLDPAG